MNHLLVLLGRRLLTLVPLVLGIILLVTLIMEPAKDTAAYAYFQGANVTPEQIAQFKHEAGLDQPIAQRFFEYIANLVQGDFGKSSLSGTSVAEKISTAFPLTVQLTLYGILIAFVTSLVLGVVAALFRDEWPDQLIRFVSLIGVASPSFWLALLFIAYFAIQLGWFPSGGYVNPGDDFGGFIVSLTLPAFSLSLPVAAQMTRIVRTSMVEELNKDYVRTARGAGIPYGVVVGRNVLRNALINPLTVLGLRVGYLLGGAVIIETIYTLPGMGQVMIDAVRDSDLPVLQGVVLVIALAFVVVNLIVDILYLLVNPRLRTGQK